MNKSDLKDGMVVELRNGGKRVVWGKDLYEIHALKLTVVNCINNYNNDLYYTFTDSKRNLDIMKVSYGDELLWERKEIDWSKMPIGIKVLVRDNLEEEWKEAIFVDESEEGKFITYDRYNHMQEYWNYCKLAEGPKEEVEVVSLEELENKYESFEDVECNECRYCKYEKFNVCEFAWLLDNYNVTRKDNK